MALIRANDANFRANDANRANANRLVTGLEAVGISAADPPGIRVRIRRVST